jgi:hypothetical protein
MHPSVRHVTLIEGVGYNPITALGDDLLGFWDAEDAATLTLSGGKVSAWADKIGAYTPAQATEANQPVYDATSLNGRPAVEFDGTAHHLTLASVPFPTGGTECEIWMLARNSRPGATTALNTFFAYGNTGTVGTARYLGRVGASGVNRNRAVGGDGSANFSANGTAVDTEGIHVFRGKFLADGVTGEVDGQVDGEAAGTLGGTSTTRLRIGANASTTAANFALIDVNKILVTRPLSDAKATRLRQWLATLGGVALYSPFEETIDPTEWETISLAEPYAYNGVDYHNDSAEKSYSIMRSLTHSNFLRFEVQEGDEWEGDIGRPTLYDRAELGAYIGYHPYGVERWFSYSQKARGVYADGTRNLFQIFNDDVELQVQSTPSALVFRTYHYEGEERQTVVRHTAAAMQDDVPEDFVIRALPIPSGGELQVWRNGVELFNATGIPFGTAVEWKRHKFGVYRTRKPDRFVMEMANFQYGDDLSAKILNPDPHPALWA